MKSIQKIKERANRRELIYDARLTRPGGKANPANPHQATESPLNRDWESI